MKKISVYDTTLRDGVQGEGVSFSSIGKVHLALRLDEFGVDYIEGGYAASNPKDMEFFRAIKKETLKHAKIAAFGSTRRAGKTVEEDPGMQALIEAETEVVTIFGKAWDLHVHEVLRVTPEENLAMISDSVAYLKSRGREVIYDAEHFFDGYKANPEYALASLRAAAEAGADRVVLCDTNGGCLPNEIYSITEEVGRLLDVSIGIHTHNDAGLADANSLEAVRAGAMQVQGTINGFGERTGNANLCTILPCLELKMGCETAVRLKELRQVSLYAYELSNVRPDKKDPFVGESAFAHKAGMHVNGVQKNPVSFEHTDPAAVGNKRRVLISELSGASNIFLKAVEMGMSFQKNDPELKNILHEMERLEKDGYEYEAAEASFKLMIQKVLKLHKPFFNLEAFRVIVEKRNVDEPCISEATVKLSVNGEEELTAGEGHGPVDALNQAMRRALTRFYPGIEDVFLTDYRVRILDPEEATAAKTRVLIESSDGVRNWGTVGVSENLIEASWEALVDSVEYKLLLEEQSPKA
ncbi:MAG: citramalate synthase [Kiritimatiellae bacterium]|nr:citramalate synthase [Kiritimatiellia bacterium]